MDQFYGVKGHAFDSFVVAVTFGFIVGTFIFEYVFSPQIIGFIVGNGRVCAVEAGFVTGGDEHTCRRLTLVDHELEPQ